MDDLTGEYTAKPCDVRHMEVPRIGSFFADSTSVARRPRKNPLFVKSAAMDGRFLILALMDQRIKKDKAAVVADGRFGRGAQTRLNAPRLLSCYAPGARRGSQSSPTCLLKSS